MNFFVQKNDCENFRNEKIRNGANCDKIRRNKTFLIYF